MFKKIALLTAAAMISLTTLVSADQSTPSFTVNGQLYEYEKYYERPYISEQGELMASISITLKLADKGSAYYNGINQSVLMYRDGQQFNAHLGQTSVTVDGKEYQFDTPITKKYGRVFMPLWVLKAIYGLEIQVQTQESE